MTTRGGEPEGTVPSTDPASDVTALDHRALDEARCVALAGLEMTLDQAEFGGGFPDTIEEIEAAPEGLGMGVVLVLDGAPVGLCLLKRPPFSPSWAVPDAVTLHGLKIDRRRQGAGLGRRLLGHAVGMARLAWPYAFS